MGCANGTTVRQPFALMHQFGICDHQDATAEGRKDESFGAKTPHTPQTAALLQHFGWECLTGLGWPRIETGGGRL